MSSMMMLCFFAPGLVDVKKGLGITTVECSMPASRGGEGRGGRARRDWGASMILNSSTHHSLSLLLIVAVFVLPAGVMLFACY